ncbi:MAG: BirA family biotin operon repressor/biotin-[acetyl-CoA-carboxylase] ligase [Patiriisocius sp.]|jgi:BirA family biotin operon repressor/biotin-[acetyl-CoA-carboxylase] ligase
MNTLFVGQNRIFFDHIDSTNKYLANHEKLTDFPEGTAVIADYQSAGKGQRDRVWHSNAGANVTLSVLLRPKFLKAQDYFILNKGVTLAVLNTIEHFVKDPVSIKWPNDTLVNNKKIAGLLVELNWRAHHCQNAIIGLGLNVNQTNFNKLPNATSLKLLMGELKVEEVYEIFFKNLEFQYLQIRKMQWNGIILAYNERLWGRGEEISFTYQNEIKQATLIGVGNDGLLKLRVDNKEQAFANGEIEIEYS